MGQELLREYLQTNQRKDCATVAFHALLPRNPSPKSVEAVFDNTVDIDNTAFYIFLEWLKKDVVTYIHYIDDGELDVKLKILKLYAIN